MHFIGHMGIEQRLNQFSKKNPMEHFVYDEQRMILFASHSNISIVSSYIFARTGVGLGYTHGSSALMVRVHLRVACTYDYDAHSDIVHLWSWCTEGKCAIMVRVY